MDDINLNFKNSGTFLTTGVIWIVVGILNLIQLVLFPLFFQLSLLLLISLVLNIYLAVYYLTLSKQTYVKISSDFICIYRGTVFKFYEIKFEEISEVEVCGNKLFIVPVKDFSKKELIIRTDYLYRRDFQILIDEFNKYGIPIRNLYGSKM